MNRSVYCWAVTGLLAVLAMGIPLGCSTAGTKFDTTAVSRLVKGATTKHEVRAYFGNPLRTEFGPAGEVWTYTYVETHTTGTGAVGHFLVGVEQSESVVNMLTIIFDGEVVKDYQFDSRSHTDTYLPLR